VLFSPSAVADIRDGHVDHTLAVLGGGSALQGGIQGAARQVEETQLHVVRAVRTARAPRVKPPHLHMQLIDEVHKGPAHQLRDLAIEKTSSLLVGVGDDPPAIDRQKPGGAGPVQAHIVLSDTLSTDELHLELLHLPAKLGLHSGLRVCGSGGLLSGGHCVLAHVRVPVVQSRQGVPSDRLADGRPALTSPLQSGGQQDRATDIGGQHD